MEFGSAEGEGLRRFTVRCTIQDANVLLETGRRQDRAGLERKREVEGFICKQFEQN